MYSGVSAKKCNFKITHDITVTSSDFCALSSANFRYEFAVNELLIADTLNPTVTYDYAGIVPFIKHVYTDSNTRSYMCQHTYTYKLCVDAACVTDWTDTAKVSFDQTTKVLTIYRSVGYAEQNLYLVIEIDSVVTATIPIKVEVCGAETVSLVTSGFSLSYTKFIGDDSGTDEFVIDKSTYMSEFSVDATNCGIKTYSILSADGSTNLTNAVGTITMYNDVTTGSYNRRDIYIDTTSRIASTTYIIRG